jgi:pseudouridine kinase
MTDLCVIGGAHIDRLARLAAHHRPQTSNPATINETIGGGGFNAARAARRMGARVAILSARGGDASGVAIANAIQDAGLMDLSSTHLDRATPTYTAILEPNGELVTAIADMALYEQAIARTLSRSPVKAALEASRSILVDANLSADVLSRITAQYNEDMPVFALAISSAKALRLREALPRFSAIFLNRHEASALNGLSSEAPSNEHAKALSALGVQRASISAGAECAALLDHGQVMLIEPPRIDVIDVTGAGDALAGTAISTMLQGHDFASALRFGHAAAALTACALGPCPPINKNAIVNLAQSLNWSER